MQKKATFFTEFSKAAIDAPRLYFAPLAGAIDAVRREIARVNASMHCADKDSTKSGHTSK